MNQFADAGKMVNPIKAIIHAYAQDPTSEDAYVEMSILIDLPFVPPLGSFMVPVKGGDYIQIYDIHINVFSLIMLDIGAVYKTPLRPVNEMIEEGWERDD